MVKMTIEDSMENWENIAKKLKTAGMEKSDIDTVGQLGGAVHTLDKLAFQEHLPFVFYPSKFDGSPAGHENGKYHIRVEGIHDEFVRFEEDLKKGWPPYTHEFITQDLIAYSRGIGLVRFRAQEELKIELFTPEHAGKITKIPILNQIIQSNAQIDELISGEDAPNKFDAHVIGSYAIMIGYECKSNGASGEEIAKRIHELVKLDVKKL